MQTISPENYTPPTHTPSNKTALYNSNKNAAKIAIQDYVTNANKPVPYLEVAKTIALDFPLSVGQAMQLVREVDEEWHPEKFETPTAAAASAKSKTK